MTTTGYIVFDNESLIHGTGATAEAAWADAEGTFAAANVELLDDDADSTECHGSWTRRSSLRVCAATAALLAAVTDCGGAIAWHTTADGIACTRDEYDD
jgi:hypothetical protein